MQILANVMWHMCLLFNSAIMQTQHSKTCKKSQEAEQGFCFGKSPCTHQRELVAPGALALHGAAVLRKLLPQEPLELALILPAAHPAAAINTLHKPSSGTHAWLLHCMVRLLLQPAQLNKPCSARPCMHEQEHNTLHHSGILQAPAVAHRMWRTALRRTLAW